jgi:hypothetical protein
MQLADRLSGGKTAQVKKPAQTNAISSLMSLFSKTSK